MAASARSRRLYSVDCEDYMTILWKKHEIRQGSNLLVCAGNIVYVRNQLVEGGIVEERVDISYTLVCSVRLSRCEAEAVISMSTASRGGFEWLGKGGSSSEIAL